MGDNTHPHLLSERAGHTCHKTCLKMYRMEPKLTRGKYTKPETVIASDRWDCGYLFYSLHSSVSFSLLEKKIFREANGLAPTNCFLHSAFPTAAESRQRPTLGLAEACVLEAPTGYHSSAEQRMVPREPRGRVPQGQEPWLASPVFSLTPLLASSPTCKLHLLSPSEVKPLLC